MEPGGRPLGTSRHVLARDLGISHGIFDILIGGLLQNIEPGSSQSAWFAD